MSTNVEYLCLQLSHATNKIRIQSMFGLRGIFFSGIFLGYLDHKENNIYLRECTLTKKLAKEFGELKTYVMTKRHFEANQKVYLVPKSYYEDTKSLEAMLRSAYLDRLEIETTNELNRELRIKDLPNMTLSIERMLKEVDINTPEELFEIGSQAAFARILKNKSVNSKLILKIEGAITGKHEAVIPSTRRSELINFSRFALETPNKASFN
ncbi:putative DNA transformation protein TfoX2 [Vibrio jasicida]|uniref:DNA transformation protein TfoX2 n=1 Tax=Vibrio jasicida TaxID=766224 RepID=A0AAU9QV40_9VIBR|nr:TfoX/Sxy family DNA transformation protein [Vibrio alginolyticus]CAH1598895.1 putative DNA transformation protein TfoX2 [Vibrio jasicida]CAH1601440.1 putative DNA transformation protein TfoX2 [Vibrio jasicida]